jgi:ABC-type transporter Mla subunit MlaD
VTALTPVERDDRRRLRRRREVTRWSIRVLLVVLVFALGVALGQAIQDNPQPGRTVTFDRTLSISTAGNQGSTITP